MALDYVPAVVPPPGQVVSVVLQMTTFGVLCICFTRRTSWLKNWQSLPLAIWLILIIYVDSTLFVLATSIIVHGLGINSSRAVCEGGILLCLVCYMTTKILIYYFLVERAYIVRGSRKPRLKTKLWLFNCLFMMLPYTVFVIMNFVWRITYINDKGVCIIGMQKIAMLPLITFEVVVNIYLTLLFILPLRKLYSYQNSTNPKLNRMASRSLVGSLATLTTSVVNLTVLMVLKGEPGWICLMCCNADILFCVVVLHWVTSKDKPSSYTSTHASGGGTADETVRDETVRDKTGSVLTGQVWEGSGSGTATRGSTAKGLMTWDIIEPVLSPLRQSQLHQHNSASQNHCSCSCGPISPTSPPHTCPPGLVMTQINGPHVPVRSKSKSRVLQKSRVSSELGEDEVELHAIHVQREVIVDRGRSASVETGSAFDSRERVSSEKMV